MRLVKPKFEIINRDNTIYLKSKTVFINRYIHPEDGEEEEYNPLERYCLNKYSKVKDDGDNYYITTSIEVLLENGWESDLKYICDPTKYHEKRYTVKFTCNNNFYNLLTSKYWYTVRNFDISKDINIKDGELTFIIPYWLDIPEDTYSLGKLRSKNNPERTCMVEISENNGAYNVESPIGKFLHVLDYSSDRYIELINEGWKPQEARAVLPNSLKIELFISGFESDWEKLFNIVKDEELKELLDPLKEEFIKNNYINE